MATAVLIVTLLTVAASLASWLFSQWLARRARISGAALAVAGGGTVLLIGSVALIFVAASTGRVHFIPVEDFSMLEPAPMPVRSTETAVVEREAEPSPQPEQPQAEPPAELVQVAEPSPVFAFEPAEKPVPRATFNEPKEGMLAAAERHLAQSCSRRASSARPHVSPTHWSPGDGATSRPVS